MKNFITFLSFKNSKLTFLSLMMISFFINNLSSKNSLAQVRVGPGRAPVPILTTPSPIPHPFPPSPLPTSRPVPQPIPLPSSPFCPPGTIYNPELRRCVSVNTPPMQQRPPRDPNDIDEVSATNIVNSAMRGLDCSQAAESLRRLSNQLLSMGVSGSQPSIPGRTEPDFKKAWRERIRSPQFWSKVWNKMADAYRSCNRGCFDDGLAVGQISASGYCSASIAVNGLMGVGYIEQPPLPVCETATFSGCIKGYQNTASNFPGCVTYMTDSFSSIFNQYVSQDCHL